MPTNKYNAIRSAANEKIYPELKARSFPSQIERDRAQELVLLQRAGDISELVFQPRVYVSGISYHPDCAYRERKSGEKDYEEVKGLETERWRIVKKLWYFSGPGVLYIMKRGRDGRIHCVETIAPTNAAPPRP